jgi:hypothetical protein
MSLLFPPPRSLVGRRRYLLLLRRLDISGAYPLQQSSIVANVVLNLSGESFRNTLQIIPGIARKMARAPARKPSSFETCCYQILRDSRSSKRMTQMFELESQRSGTSVLGCPSFISSSKYLHVTQQHSTDKLKKTILQRPVEGAAFHPMLRASKKCRPIVHTLSLIVTGSKPSRRPQKLVERAKALNRSGCSFVVYSTRLPPFIKWLYLQ